MALSHIITIILNTINITTTNTIITKIKIMVSEMLVAPQISNAPVYTGLNTQSMGLDGMDGNI